MASVSVNDSKGGGALVPVSSMTMKEAWSVSLQIAVKDLSFRVKEAWSV